MHLPSCLLRGFHGAVAEVRGRQRSQGEQREGRQKHSCPFTVCGRKDSCLRGASLGAQWFGRLHPRSSNLWRQKVCIMILLDWVTGWILIFLNCALVKGVFQQKESLWKWKQNLLIRYKSIRSIRSFNLRWRETLFIVYSSKIQWFSNKDLFFSERC